MSAEVDVFAALANPVRRGILVVLRAGPRPVNDLVAGTGLGRPAVSEHLQVLRKAKLVREEPRGRERWYHLDPGPLEDVGLWLDAFGPYWTARLDALAAVMDEDGA